MHKPPWQSLGTLQGWPSTTQSGSVPVHAELHTPSLAHGSVVAPVEPVDPVEPVVAPVVDPVVDPVVEPVVDPVVEPVVEPVVDPVVDPVVEPVVDPVEPLEEPPVVVLVPESLAAMNAAMKSA